MIDRTLLINIKVVDDLIPPGDNEGTSRGTTDSQLKRIDSNTKYYRPNILINEDIENKSRVILIGYQRDFLHE